MVYYDFHKLHGLNQIYKCGDVFRTQSNMYYGAFFENSQQLLDVNYFRKKSSILDTRLDSKCK